MLQLAPGLVWILTVAFAPCRIGEVMLVMVIAVGFGVGLVAAGVVADCVGVVADSCLGVGGGVIGVAGSVADPVGEVDGGRVA